MYVIVLRHNHTPFVLIVVVEEPAADDDEVISCKLIINVRKRKGKHKNQ